MSPCIICFTLSVCNVATPSLLAKAVCNVATWSLLCNKCMQGRHLALPENRWNWTGLHLSLIYQFLNELMKENWHKQHNGCFWIITRSSIHVYAMSPWTTHKYKHICNVVPWTLRCKKCMQGCHFFFLMEGDMQCRHVTPVISIQRNQIPLRCQRNLKITLDCLIFCMQCRHAIPLVNWTVYAMSPCGWPKKWYAVSPCDPVCQQYTLCNVAPHPFTGMHICNVAA